MWVGRQLQTNKILFWASLRYITLLKAHFSLTLFIVYLPLDSMCSGGATLNLGNMTARQIILSTSPTCSQSDNSSMSGSCSSGLAPSPQQQTGSSVAWLAIVYPVVLCSAVYSGSLSCLYEPSREIMVLFSLRKLILQACMCSCPVGQYV